MGIGDKREMDRKRGRGKERVFFASNVTPLSISIVLYRCVYSLDCI